MTIVLRDGTSFVIRPGSNIIFTGGGIRFLTHDKNIWFFKFEDILQIERN